MSAGLQGIHEQHDRDVRIAEELAPVSALSSWYYLWLRQETSSASLFQRHGHAASMCMPLAPLCSLIATRPHAAQHTSLTP